MGFPRGNSQGQTNVFRAARQCLPGPVRPLILSNDRIIIYISQCDGIYQQDRVEVVLVEYGIYCLFLFVFSILSSCKQAKKCQSNVQLLVGVLQWAVLPVKVWASGCQMMLFVKLSSKNWTSLCCVPGDKPIHEFMACTYMGLTWCPCDDQRAKRREARRWFCPGTVHFAAFSHASGFVVVQVLLVVLSPGKRGFIHIFVILALLMSLLDGAV